MVRRGRHGGLGSGAERHLGPRDVRGRRDDAGVFDLSGGGQLLEGQDRDAGEGRLEKALERQANLRGDDHDGGLAGLGAFLLLAVSWQLLCHTRRKSRSSDFEIGMSDYVRDEL